MQKVEIWRISLTVSRYRSKDGIVHVWDVGDPLKDGSALDPKPLKLAFFAKPDHGDLTSLDWNFDGSLLAIGSYDSILRICTASGKLYFSHRQHEVRQTPSQIDYNSC